VKLFRNTIYRGNQQSGVDIYNEFNSKNVPKTLFINKRTGTVSREDSVELIADFYVPVKIKQ